MGKRPLKNRGWTLAEALVASVIFSLALGFMYGTYFSGNDLWQVSSDSDDLRARARIALDRVTSELKSATRTSSQAPSPNLRITSPGQAHFYLPADEDGDGTLTGADGEIEWDTDNQVKYQFVPGQRELRRLDKGGDIILARDVESVLFEDADTDPSLPLTETRVTLWLKKTTPRGRSVSCAMSANVKLRN